MKPLPHRYEVRLAGGPAGYGALTAAGFPALPTAPPVEFDGPGDALRHVPTTVPVDLKIDTGRVPDRLAAAAAAGGPTALLVLGRGTHRDRGGAPGSTAYRVLTQTGVPVLMYHAEE